MKAYKNMGIQSIREKRRCDFTVYQTKESGLINIIKDGEHRIGNPKINIIYSQV